MFKVSVINNFCINYEKSVLIIIDMINGFTDFGPLRSEFIKNISTDIRNLCNKFSNIIAINDSHNEDDCEFNVYPSHCIKGSFEGEICEELLDVKFTEVLNKNCTNGFFSEGFLDTFKKYLDSNFDFVVVGCCVDICILEFCLTFKGYLNSINKNSNIIIPVNLVETYDGENHKREEVKNASLYIMNNSGIKLIDSIL